LTQLSRRNHNRYGYLLFREASVGGGVRFATTKREEGASCGDEVKVRLLLGACVVSASLLL